MGSVLINESFQSLSLYYLWLGIYTLALLTSQALRLRVKFIHMSGMLEDCKINKLPTFLYAYVHTEIMPVIKLTLLGDSVWYLTFYIYLMWVEFDWLMLMADLIPMPK